MLDPALDVLVVGAGIAGLLSAIELHDHGLKVALADAGAARPPASWAGGGILSPLFPWRYPDATHLLCRDALSDYHYWRRRILLAGGEDPEIREDGALIYSRDPDRANQWATRLGVPLKAADNNHYQGSAGTSALSMPQLASIRNPQLLVGLRHLVATLGISILPHQVRSICLTGEGVSVRFGKLDQQVPRVLVTAGAWASELLASWQHEPIFPVRGQMLLYRCPVPLPTIVLDEAGYLIPRADGLVLAGSTVEYHQQDMRPTETACKTLRAMAERLWPLLRESTLLAQWAGIRPGTRRQLPIIGQLPDSAGRVWLNGGHFRNGLVCGPAAARLVGRLMVGASSDIDPSPYAPVPVPSSSSLLS